MERLTPETNIQASIEHYQQDTIKISFKKIETSRS